ncbi:hypothetical protein ACJIZ3_021903 [Penstemon smallii]|uniref:Peptidase A1 domain-containing protein n=1 Tax=Penstemon smallii TaxID=265156 RepID=A0ABD3SMT5_9LAMI
MTIEDIVKKDLEITKAFYMKESSSFLPTSFDANVGTKGNRGFTAYLEVGEKRVKQYLYMDTGSSLLWINCDPNSYNAPYPIYDPKKSSSYKIQRCINSPFCAGLGAVKTWCGEKYMCNYEQRFIDGNKNSGHLAAETFFFNISQSSAENIVFGCTARTTLFVNGILGLGPNKVSIVSQLDSTMFAYCIGNISDVGSSLNTLSIGSLVLHYPTIPLIIDDKFYVNVFSIEFGYSRSPPTTLAIDPKIFKRNSENHTGGMVIDSASTLSFLPRLALDKVVESMRHLLDPVLQRSASVEWKGNIYTYHRLCYHGNLNYNLNVSPYMKLNFEDGGYMYLEVDNMFQQVGLNTFCLAFLPSDALGVQFSIMGALMQQHFRLIFDLSNKMISISSTDDCSVDDY